MQHWDLTVIPAPAGTRDPSVLETADGARAVLVRLDVGQELGDHEVKERTWMFVVEGAVAVEAGGERVEARAGTLVTFEPEERHAVSTAEGARILLLLAPWPGAGHYRGGGGPPARSEAGV